MGKPHSLQSDAAVHGARLVIDLDAIAANYRKLAAMAAPARAAAAVKADAYGLGLAPVARSLAKAGCETFFVAHFSEGAALRAILKKARIYVLHGLPADAAQFYMAHALSPVLNSLPELAAWRGVNGPQGGVILNFDTGMSRLGMSAHDAAQLVSEPGLLAGVTVDYIMSHLSCADDPAHPLNVRQNAAFQRLRALFPHAPASLANTAGVLLGADYHHDLVRPGIGLFGGSLSNVDAGAFQRVVALYAKILQIQDVDRQDYVGYGATFCTDGPGRIAVAGIGYADGYMRALGNSGFGAIGGHRAPCVGRVSMDLCTFDVTAVPAHLCVPGAEIELIGPNVNIDEVAAGANTLGYEILTRLGSRFARSYHGDGSGKP
ncbi:MAG: alanine racemase [Alphaproteobacteria bacterium]|nr:alanine racemase [Alphaproteobacteria bacterium]